MRYHLAPGSSIWGARRPPFLDARGGGDEASSVASRTLTVALAPALLAPALFTAAPVALAAGPPSGQPGQEPELVDLEHLQLIALDPGHGGSNHGCLGIHGTYEKEVTLVLALLVERILLEETDAAVLLTRREDRPLGLRERTELANGWAADVFLSIHINADAFGRGHGVEAWFLAPESADEEAQRIVAAEEAAYGEQDDPPVGLERAVDSVALDASLRATQAASEVLAETIATGMHDQSRAPFRGVKQARFGVLKAARMPAVVVETGFFTHGIEGHQLLDPVHQAELARGIVDGLVAFDRRMGGKKLAER